MSTGDDAMRVPNGISSVLHHPRLAAKYLNYNALLLREQVLTHRQRELAVLRVAWRTRSQYEWLQHVRLSQRYDVSTAEVEAIGAGAEGGSWAPLDAAILRATDQLLDSYRIDDDTWSQLAAELEADALVELVFVVGTYANLAMVFNSLGVELDPDLDPASAPPLPTDQ
jgi:alkylhydroperoxidase family enzyme